MDFNVTLTLRIKDVASKESAIEVAVQRLSTVAPGYFDVVGEITARPEQPPRGARPRRIATGVEAYDRLLNNRT